MDQESERDFLQSELDTVASMEEEVKANIASLEGQLKRLAILRQAFQRAFDALPEQLELKLD